MLFCEMYYRTIEDICFYLLAFGGGVSAIVVAVTTIIHAVVSHRDHKRILKELKSSRSITPPDSSLPS